VKKAKLLALFGSICLVLALVVSLSGGLALVSADRPQDELPPGIEKTIQPEAEIPLIDGLPITPNVRPVILLSGSDYEMGYQLNRQLVQVFGTWILEDMTRDYTKEKFSKEELDALQGYEWYIKEYTPEMIDFIEGMVDGAKDAGVKLSYEQVLATFTGIRYYGTPPGSGEASEECGAWAAWGEATKDGKLICHSTTDHEISFEFTIVGFPEEGNNFIISPYSPTSYGFWIPRWMGGHPWMNNKGLMYVHHGASQFARCRPTSEWGYGVPRFCLTLHTLRFADSAAQALELAYEMPSPDAYWGGFWADVSGDAFVCENRENPEVIRRAGDFGETDFLYATNNAVSDQLGHCQVSPPDPNYYVPHGGWLNKRSVTSVLRNLGCWNLLHNYNGEVDLEFAMMSARFPGKGSYGYATLEEAQAAYIPTLGKGWDEHICHQANAMVGIAVPDDGDEGLYYVSAVGCPAKVSTPHGNSGWYFRVDATHSFYQLKLASSFDEVVNAARGKAHLDLYYADLELDKLGYSDTAYAPLLEIFDKAVLEWGKARDYMHLAENVPEEDLEYLELSAKALRAYTRCQAFAQQVYNELVPPPTCPEDLGLGPWFGDWGEWATIPYDQL